MTNNVIVSIFLVVNICSVYKFLIFMKTRKIFFTALPCFGGVGQRAAIFFTRRRTAASRRNTPSLLVLDFMEGKAYIEPDVPHPSPQL
jgi:hypothetical protein